MPRYLTVSLCLLALSCGAMGCASSGLFGRKTVDWRSSPSNLRQGNARKSSEDPLDKFIWSDEARDINRSVGGAL
jgi:hypothetical protein